LFRQTSGLLGTEQALLERLLHDDLVIDAAAIIANLDAYLVAEMDGADPDGGLLGFLCQLPLLRQLDTVIETIADEMGHGARQGIHHPFVDFDILALELEAHLLAQLSRGIAYHPRQLLKDPLAGLHAQAHGVDLQIVDTKIHFPRDAAKILIFFEQTANGRVEAIAQQHQFAHLIHDRIQAGGIDAEGIFYVGGSACRVRDWGCRLALFLGGLGRWLDAGHGNTRCPTAIELVEHLFKFGLGDVVARVAGG